MISTLSLSALPASSANEIIRLSEMTEDECIEFIVANGISIPDELSDYSALGAFVKNIITVVENDPNYSFVINYPITFDLANQIKKLVNEYYGNTGELCASLFSNQSLSYTLQYSTVYGPWLDEYLGYNCYGFALGQTRPYDGFYNPHYPGCFSLATAGDFSLDMTVGEMADLTVSDIESLGYSCIKHDISYSSVISLADTHNIICLRKCSTVGKEDYHYMRLFESDWRHKPGNTHVLTFNYLPYAHNWYNETSFMGDTADGDRYYTGTIHYFAYRENHSYLSTYANDEYHLGSTHYFYMEYTCSGCGDTYYAWESRPCSGPPCPITLSTPSGENEMS